MLLDEDGTVVASAEERRGHRHTLRRHTRRSSSAWSRDWPKVPAILAGMIGSRQGWREAAYVPCPADAGGARRQHRSASRRARPRRRHRSRRDAARSAPRRRRDPRRGNADRRTDRARAGLRRHRHPSRHPFQVGDDRRRRDHRLPDLPHRRDLRAPGAAFLPPPLRRRRRPRPCRACRISPSRVRRTAEEGLPFLAAIFSVRVRQLLDDVAREDNLAYLSGLVIGGEIAAARAAGWLKAGAPTPHRRRALAGACLSHAPSRSSASPPKRSTAARWCGGPRPACARHRLPAGESSMSDPIFGGHRPLIAILRGITPDEAECGAGGADRGRDRPDRGAAQLARSVRQHRRMADERRRASARRRRHRAVGRRRRRGSPAAGGRLIVSPNRDDAVIRATRAAGLDSYPGVFTATEALGALAAGADALKFFPADVLGPAGIRAIAAILPTGDAAPRRRRRRRGQHRRLARGRHRRLRHRLEPLQAGHDGGRGRRRGARQMVAAYDAAGLAPCRPRKPAR